MAVDTSALYAIAILEPEEKLFSRMISERGAVVGTPTLLELTMALSRIGPDRTDRFITRLLRDGILRPVEFTSAMFETALSYYP